MAYKFKSFKRIYAIDFNKIKNITYICSSWPINSAKILFRSKVKTWNKISKTVHFSAT